MISIDSVVKQYSPSVRIGSISLDIPAGGITALVGPNGAGKSTLLTMVGRLLGIDEGTIEVGGLNDPAPGKPLYLAPDSAPARGIWALPPFQGTFERQG